MAGGPLDGEAIVLAAAKASVSGERLPGLVDDVQAHLGARRETYDRQYECVYEDDTLAVYLVEHGHWTDLGPDLDLEDREWQAVRRAHREHLGRLGIELGRRAEFDTSLEVRDPVVVGKDA